ncbi:MAG: hypothetical protein HKN47_22480 [Pirellulaceae bacterium]|nr:hypothetical protein [Pirellulaceae bacterium]
MKTMIKLSFAILCAMMGYSDLNAQNSGDVRLRFSGNDVQITGDDNDNAVCVSVMPAGNKSIVQVEGLWGTTVNGKVMVSRAITNLDDMRMDFDSGTNRIYIDDYVAQTTHGDIIVNGSGLDFVSIKDGLARKIHVTGATFVTCESIEVEDECSIFATEHDDTILFDSRNSGGLHVETFDGQDVIDVAGGIYGDVSIISGLDPTPVRRRGTQTYIGPALLNQTNSDSDDVILTDLQCYNLTVSTGSGNDRIDCIDGEYGFWVVGAAQFDGGEGTDFLFLNEIFQRDTGAKQIWVSIPDRNEVYDHDNFEFVFGELPDITGPTIVGGW